MPSTRQMATLAFPKDPRDPRRCWTIVRIETQDVNHQYNFYAFNTATKAEMPERPSYDDALQDIYDLGEWHNYIQ